LPPEDEIQAMLEGDKKRKKDKARKKKKQKPKGSHKQ